MPSPADVSFTMSRSGEARAPSSSDESVSGRLVPRQKRTEGPFWLTCRTCESDSTRTHSVSTPSSPRKPADSVRNLRHLARQRRAACEQSTPATKSPALAKECGLSTVHWLTFATLHTSQVGSSTAHINSLTYHEVTHIDNGKSSKQNMRSNDRECLPR